MPFKYRKATKFYSVKNFLGGGQPRFRHAKSELSPAVVQILQESARRLDVEGVRPFSKADVANFFNSL